MHSTCSEDTQAANKIPLRINLRQQDKIRFAKCYSTQVQDIVMMPIHCNVHIYYGFNFLFPFYQEGKM